MRFMRNDAPVQHCLTAWQQSLDKMPMRRTAYMKPAFLPPPTTIHAQLPLTKVVDGYRYFLSGTCVRAYGIYHTRTWTNLGKQVTKGHVVSSARTA